MTEPAITPGTMADYPTGFFTYTVGDASSVVEFDGQGRATATLAGEVIVVAAYRVSGDVFEVVDVEGSYAPMNCWTSTNMIEIIGG